MQTQMEQSIESMRQEGDTLSAQLQALRHTIARYEDALRELEPPTTNYLRSGLS